MLDDMFDLLAQAKQGPAWRPIPAEIQAAIREPIPMEAQGLEKVYRDYSDQVLPYSTGNRHPRFFGWVMGTGTVTGMLAEMLKAASNPHMGGFNHSALHVEIEVLRWLSLLLGFPENSSGILVGGGSMANMNGLAVARQQKAPWDVRAEGMFGQPQLTVYASSETHNWLIKACELMGLGRRAIRFIPVNQQGQMDLDSCRTQIQTDLRQGVHPFCIIGNAGTTSTGSIDDLVGQRALANEFGLWFHVDGALGSLAALAPRGAALVQGQELADSLAFDLHKWGYLPFEVACILVRDPQAHRATFAQAPAYLVSADRGISKGTTFFADRGYELSREFRALKVWMALKERGVRHLGEVIQKNIDQSFYLGRLVENHAAFELLSPVCLNVVCFRYNPGGLSEAELEAVNRETLLRIQEQGIAIPSHARIHDQFAIRVCNTNHRTRFSDMDLLLTEIHQMAKKVVREMNLGKE
ncbi:MAG: amino acid decarboxylase [Acidobacteria bacterium]|nr:amino acid decarboxylase [Acidobacteriota bacterium]MCB9399024.1 amino acid decarboxylase [Acidobacteriota bacterium]